MPTASAPIFGRDVADAAWRPSKALLADSRLAGFLRATGLPDLESLQARAVDDPGWFWGAAVDDLGLDWQRHPTTVLDLAGGPEWARWWIGGAFNYAEAATGRARSAGSDGRGARWEGEAGDVRTLTNAELRTAVERAARRSARSGVGAGDRVGVFLPMLPETVIATLALGHARGDLHADLLGLRRAGRRDAPARTARPSVLVTADGFCAAATARRR